MKQTVIVMWIVVLCVWGWVISGALAQQRMPPSLEEPRYTGQAEWRRNWARENGSNEHACSRDGRPIGPDETPNWHACSCQHRNCDAINGNEEQAKAAWDANCKAKCKRSHCHCRSDCHGT